RRGWRRAWDRGRRCAQSCYRGAAETPICSRWAREPPADSAQICAREPGRRRSSKGPAARCTVGVAMKALIVDCSETTMQRGCVAFVALIGLLPFVLSACTSATSTTDPRTQAPLVRIETIKTSAQAERSFSGIVAARVQSDLGFRVPGKILERLVDTGHTVKRGPPLMRIDPTDLGLALR